MDGMQAQQAAARLRALAMQARRAGGLADGSRQLEWKSLAGDRFRQALDHEAVLVRRCADLLDDAALSLTAHALGTGTERGVPAVRATAGAR